MADGGLIERLLAMRSRVDLSFRLRQDQILNRTIYSLERKPGLIPISHAGFFFELWKPGR